MIRTETQLYFSGAHPRDNEDANKQCHNDTLDPFFEDEGRVVALYKADKQAILGLAVQVGLCRRQLDERQAVDATCLCALVSATNAGEQTGAPLIASGRP